jgi:serine/threonine protein phosphatase 1
MQLVPWLSPKKASVPDGMVVYAVGDIHGRDDLLLRLHQSITADIDGRMSGRRAQVIYLGDYIDRGPDSKAVLDRLLNQPVQGAECIFLKGNHEDAMLKFLDGQESGEQWLLLGAGATARSYGVSLRDQRGQALPADAVRTKANAALSQRHLSFLRSLKLCHAVGDYLFVHAGVRPGRCLAEQEPQDLLWIRDDFLRSRRRHEHIVVHGHAAASGVVVRRNRICVDTMAYATDRLTCLVLEGASRRFITAEL